MDPARPLDSTSTAHPTPGGSNVASHHPHPPCRRCRGRRRARSHRLRLRLRRLVGARPAPDEGWVTPGKITIATGEPAYYPWVIDDAPESGEGFESAVAYAVAEQLGFDADDVVWVRTAFDEAIAPGPKDFDFNLQQFSISDERKQAVDFSSPYYETTQVVVTTGSSPAADATSLADLKDLLIGAQTGTTSFNAIEESIQPTQGAQAFNTNDDAKLALENGQIDALVVDLPTAFYIAGAELTDGVIVGPAAEPRGRERRPVRPRARQGLSPDRPRSPRRSMPSARTARSTTSPRSGSAATTQHRS